MKKSNKIIYVMLASFSILTACPEYDKPNVNTSPFEASGRIPSHIELNRIERGAFIKISPKFHKELETIRDPHLYNLLVYNGTVEPISKRSYDLNARISEIREEEGDLCLLNTLRKPATQEHIDFDFPQQRLYVSSSLISWMMNYNSLYEYTSVGVTNYHNFIEKITCWRSNLNIQLSREEQDRLDDSEESVDPRIPLVETLENAFGNFAKVYSNDGFSVSNTSKLSMTLNTSILPFVTTTTSESAFIFVEGERYAALKYISWAARKANEIILQGKNGCIVGNYSTAAETWETASLSLYVGQGSIMQQYYSSFPHPLLSLRTEIDEGYGKPFTFTCFRADGDYSAKGFKEVIKESLGEYIVITETSEEDDEI